MPPRRRRSTHRRKPSVRHSARHARTGRHVPHPGARGKPHPHRGSHAPRPGARGPHPRHESPAQAAAARVSLAKARAAHGKGNQTSRQLAAERTNLAKARAARSAHAHGRLAGRHHPHKGSHAPRPGARHPRSRHSVTHRRTHHAARARHSILRHRRTGLHRRKHVGPVRHRSVHATRRVRHAAAHHRAVRRGGHRAVSHHRHGAVRRAAHTRTTRSRGFHHQRFGPVRKYNRAGLSKTVHWIAGHRKPIRPRHKRYAWSVPTGRARGWVWTRPRRRRVQW